MAFCDQAGLEVAVGGAARLLQLADFNRTDDINDASVQAVIQGWLDDGAALIRSAAEVKHDPEVLAALDTASLRRLYDCNAGLSGRIAHEKGASGQEMPPRLDSWVMREDEYLAALSDGHRRLGRVSGGKAAAINQAVGVIDYDPLGVGISRAGFARGFR